MDRAGVWGRKQGRPAALALDPVVFDRVVLDPAEDVMVARHILGPMAVLVMLPLVQATGQQPVFGTAAPDTTKPSRPAGALSDSAAGPPEAPAEWAALDSVVFHLLPSSRLDVKTGKAGLFGFAGHSHVIRARAFSGRVVYYPKDVSRSHLEITVLTDSLQVLTPPDTAEIRKVTEAMRSEVLHVDQYHEIRLVSREIVPAPNGFHVTGALTLVGQTRDVPIDFQVELAPDSVRARGKFSVKQTDFGIKPYSGGPAGTVKVADKVTFDIDAVAVRPQGSREVTERP
jgi:polyisoprenoid-binding protein YceI